jgi:hypothetical protein
VLCDINIKEGELNLIYCPICQAPRRVIGFERDNPRLSCGHVKRPLSLAIERRIAGCAHAAQKIVDMSVSELHLFKLERDDKVGYCPICNMIISIVLDKRGHKRCGGNLMDNPGCGCLLSESRVTT